MFKLKQGNLSQGKKIIITTIGKVGSSSIKAAYKSASFKAFPDTARHLGNFISSKNCGVAHTHNIFYSGYASQQIKLSGQNCVVYVGSRDMLRRHISAFFQNIDNKNNNYWYCPNWPTMSIEEIQHVFEQRLSKHIDLVARTWLSRFIEKHEISVSFINSALAQVQSEGISLFSCNDINYVFFQLEELNNNWHRLRNMENAFSGFPSNALFANQTRSKQFSGIYNNFLRSYRPSSSIIDISYGCDLSSFYGRDKINAQISNWK